MEEEASTQSTILLLFNNQDTITIDLDITIDVNKILIRKPISSLDNSLIGDNYFITCSFLAPGNGIMCAVCGDLQHQSNSGDYVIDWPQTRNIRGTHTFQSYSIGTGALTPLTGGVLIFLEFTGYG